MRKLIAGLVVALAATWAQATVWHVNNGVSCDNTICTSVTPCCTVQGGINKLGAGSSDSVIVDNTATYNECVTVRKSGAAQDAPLTIDLRSATLSAGTCAGGTVSTNCSPGSSGGQATINVNDTFSTYVNFVRIRGGHIIPPVGGAKGWGIFAGCTNYVEVDGVDFPSAPTRTHIGANGGNAMVGGTGVTGGNGHDLMVKNCTAAMGSRANGWHFYSGTETLGVSLIRNRVANFQGALWCVSGGAGKTEIDYNDTSNMGDDCDGPGGNRIQAYNQGALGIRYNLFRDVNVPVMSMRSYSFSTAHPAAIFSDNTVIGTGVAIDACYASDATPNGPHSLIVENSVFKGFTTAVRVEEGGTSGSCFKACGAFSERNNSYTSGAFMLNQDTDCTYTVNVTTTTPGSDPLNGSFCPVATTNSIIDSGAAETPVPFSGGTTVDRGACESGMSGGAWNTTYTFQPQDTTSSPTPTLSWTGSATSGIDFLNRDFVTVLGGDSQTKYRCEVDPTLTFDSMGIAKPYWTSGDVTSGTQSCAVGTTLPSGSWYARVRLNDLPWSAPLPFTEGIGGSVCGNGVVEAGEACDGSALNGQTCVTLGYTGGTLTCSSCNFNTSACTSPAASTTRINYIDVDSAPVGAFVTLDGRRFGVTPGTVKFGTVAATVFSWSDTRVVVTVPSAPGVVVVLTTAAALQSNTVPFQLHSGTLRYVAKTGTDAGGCTSAGAPCLTIQYCKLQTVPGDVCLVHAGNYVESSGGAGLYVRLVNSGTTSQPITFRGYPGESVTVDCGGVCGGNTVYIEGHDIQFVNMKVTGAHGTGVAVYGSDGRVADVESFGNNLAGYASTSGSDFNVQNSSARTVLLGCVAHDSGSVDNLDHGFYLKGGPDMEVGWCESYNHLLGYGLQLYDGAGTYAGATVHDSNFHHNRNGGITVNNGAVSAQVYNNTISANGRYGILVDGANNVPTGASIVNNSLSEDDTLGQGYAEIRLLRGDATVVKNNVIKNTGTSKFMQKDVTATAAVIDYTEYSSSSGSWVFEGATHATLAAWKASTSQDTHAASGDPLYFSADDLHTGAGSPAAGIADATVIPALDKDALPTVTHDAGAYVVAVAAAPTPSTGAKGKKFGGSKKKS